MVKHGSTMANMMEENSFFFLNDLKNMFRSSLGFKFKSSNY